MILVWAILFGLVGFLAGFIGPIYLIDSGQGPLVGIFLTGPGGFVLGLVAATAARFVDAPQRSKTLALVGLAALLGVGTVYACIPAPVPVGQLVEGQASQCRDPRELRDDTIERLRTEEPRYREGVRTSWGDAFDRALRERSGVVVNLAARRIRPLFEGRAPWERGEALATPWATSGATMTVYAEKFGCWDFAPGVSRILYVHGGVGIWRPSNIGEMLNLPMGSPPPPEYAAFASP